MDDDMQKSDIILLSELEKTIEITPKKEPEELKHLRDCVEFSQDGHERYKGVSQSFGAAIFIGSLTYLAIKAALGYELTEDDRFGAPFIACLHPGILYACRFMTWLERRSSEKELGKYLKEHPEFIKEDDKIMEIPLTFQLVTWIEGSSAEKEWEKYLTKSPEYKQR